MRCPICNSQFDAQYSTAKPFCSERCRTIDLGRWLEEDHSLPVVPDPEDDELPEPQPGEADIEDQGDDFVQRN